MSKQKKCDDEILVDSSQQMINQDQKHGIDIVFENIAYSVRIPDKQVKSKIPCQKVYREKEILKGISGIFKAGQTNAIMGASGAGKTTLLNVLACRIPTTSKNSKLYANNVEYTYDTFGDFANYVMQTDVLMQTLTVRETLDFAATLKMNKSGQQKKNILAQLTKDLKLQKCLDTLIGGAIVKGVSGGQKKRTSIAVELISDPKVIFLDEPTSGLDSLTSQIIIIYLKKLATFQHKTVIMTIHQPNSDIFKLFDNLILLLEGKLIYQAKANKVAAYFSSTFDLTCPEFINPADYVMANIHYENEKNRARYPEYFESYNKNQGCQVALKIKNKQTRNPQLRKVERNLVVTMKALMYRNVLNTIRNPMLLKSKFLQEIFISLFIGGVYFNTGNKDYTDRAVFNSITGFVFFRAMHALMAVLSPASIAFPLERVVFQKEQDSKMYNTTSYFLAKNIVELPQMAILSIMAVLIYYWMIGLASTAGQILTHMLVFFLLGFAGSSLGMLIGSVVHDAKDTTTVKPIVFLPIILFSGFLKNREDLPIWISWMQYISPIKYGFSAFLENQVQFRPSLIQSLKFDVDKWPSIAILFGLGLGFRVLSLFFLWFLRKKVQ